MEKIIWMPCTGLKFTTPPVEGGHVGIIKVQDGDDIKETDEWLSSTVAAEKYPNIIFSSSSTRCSQCGEIYKAAAQAYLDTKQS